MKRNRTKYKERQVVGQEIGQTGLRINLGKVAEDTIKPLRGAKKIKLLEEMVRFDPTIGAFNNMYQSTASSVEWTIKPKDDTDEAKEVADFINSCFLRI